MVDILGPRLRRCEMSDRFTMRPLITFAARLHGSAIQQAKPVCQRSGPTSDNAVVCQYSGPTSDNAVVQNLLLTPIIPQKSHLLSPMMQFFCFFFTILAVHL